MRPCSVVSFSVSVGGSQLPDLFALMGSTGMAKQLIGYPSLPSGGRCGHVLHVRKAGKEGGQVSGLRSGPAES